jgi:hypothetical protein
MPAIEAQTAKLPPLPKPLDNLHLLPVAALQLQKLAVSWLCPAGWLLLLHRLLFLHSAGLYHRA